MLDLARQVMGGIDLDPASCAVANETVQASNFFALPDDGLAKEWHGKVWCNPPGGRTPNHYRAVYGTQSNACAWFRKLLDEHKAGRVQEACFLAFNLEFLQCSQDPAWEFPLDFSYCIPAKRLRFYGPTSTSSPTHGSIIIYMGPNDQAFVDAFACLGRTKLGMY